MALKFNIRAKIKIGNFFNFHYIFKLIIKRHIQYTHSSYYQFIYSYLMDIYSRCKISSSVFYFCIKIKKKNSAKPVHPSNHLCSSPKTIFFHFMIIYSGIENRMAEFWFLVDFLEKLGHYFCSDIYYFKHSFKYLRITGFQHFFWFEN